MIVEMLGQQANNYRIKATQIKQVRAERFLGDNLSRLIAKLRRSGLIREQGAWPS